MRVDHEGFVVHADFAQLVADPGWVIAREYSSGILTCSSADRHQLGFSHFFLLPFGSWRRGEGGQRDGGIERFELTYTNNVAVLLPSWGLF